MSAISLINSGVAWFVAAAVLAFLFSFQKALSGWIAGIGGAVGSLYTAAAGFTVLTGAVGVSGALSLVSYDVQISPLNAIWLITLGLCGLFVSLYNIDWHRHAQVKCNGLQINMLMAAAVCAVIASNLGMFVVMAEIMALCAVFLTSNSKEGKLWFALGRLGTLLLAIACWLLWQRYGTLDLRLLDMRMQQLPLGSDIWLLGVIGFGLLAGIIPLHGWVPQAHANASAPAAALFSTVVMKIGLLGILTLSLLGGNAPLWWGIALLVLRRKHRPLTKAERAYQPVFGSGDPLEGEEEPFQPEDEDPRPEERAGLQESDAPLQERKPSKEETDHGREN